MWTRGGNNELLKSEQVWDWAVCVDLQHESIQSQEFSALLHDSFHPHCGAVASHRAHRKPHLPKLSHFQLFVWDILNGFWNVRHWNGSLFLKCVVSDNVWTLCVLWKTDYLSLCVSLPPPSLHLLTKLMTESLQQHIAISRSIWGAQIVQNIPKFSPFLSLLCFAFPSFSLSFSLLSSQLTSPPISRPSLPLAALYFWGLCKSINEIKQTNDPVPTSFCFRCLFLALLLISEG